MADLTPELQEALDIVREARTRASNECWAARIEKKGGKALIFLHALEEMQASGENPHRRSASDQFANLFNVRVTPTMLSRHLIKQCLCSRERDY